VLHVDASSCLLSLAAGACDEHNAAFAVTVQRFDETINGREYRIEVSAVGSNTFRAQIARAPGGSRAMMPFYGSTPGEAVEHLSQWLALNHSRATTPQV
jgi:hypothetical protein